MGYIELRFSLIEWSGGARLQQKLTATSKTEKGCPNKEDDKRDN